MEMIALLIEQNFVMLLYMSLGYFLYKKKMITMVGSGEIGKVLIYIIVPIVLVKSYMTELSKENVELFLVSFVVGILTLLLSVAIARFIFGKRHPIEHFGTAFPNSGFMGIPLVQMVLGDEAVIYVSTFVALLNVLQLTYGMMVMRGTKQSMSLKSLMLNPVVISFFIGIGCFLTQIKLPTIALEMMDTLSVMNGPLAMIVLGVYLAQVPLRSLFTDKIVYFGTGVRLLLIPLITMGVLTLLPQEYYMVKMSLLVLAAAPIGTSTAIFSQLNGLDYTQAIKDICLSTMGCIITMPIILALASTLWQ